MTAPRGRGRLLREEGRSALLFFRFAVMDKARRIHRPRQRFRSLLQPSVQVARCERLSRSLQ